MFRELLSINLNDNLSGKQICPPHSTPEFKSVHLDVPLRPPLGIQTRVSQEIPGGCVGDEGCHVR